MGAACPASHPSGSSNLFEKPTEDDLNGGSSTTKKGTIPDGVKDIEKNTGADLQEAPKKDSIFRNLGILDRFLALWIFLAMAIGIILGNFVPNVGPALQKGKFVGVSVPIGKHHSDFFAP